MGVKAHRGVEDAAMDATFDYTGGHPDDMMKVAYEAYVLLAGWRLEASVVLAAGPDAPSRLAAISDADEDALGPRARTVLGCIVKSGSL